MALSRELIDTHNQASNVRDDDQPVKGLRELRVRRMVPGIFLKNPGYLPRNHPHRIVLVILAAVVANRPVRDPCGYSAEPGVECIIPSG